MMITHYDDKMFDILLKHKDKVNLQVKNKAGKTVEEVLFAHIQAIQNNPYQKIGLHAKFNQVTGRKVDYMALLKMYGVG